MDEVVRERLLRVFELVAAVVPEPEPEPPTLDGGHPMGPKDGCSQGRVASLSEEVDRRASWTVCGPSCLVLVPLVSRFKDDANDGSQVLLDLIVLNGTPCGTLWSLLHMTGLAKVDDSGIGAKSEDCVLGYSMQGKVPLDLVDSGPWLQLRKLATGEDRAHSILPEMTFDTSWATAYSAWPLSSVRGTMYEFNRFFMPPGLCIRYTTRSAAVHNVLQQIGHYVDANPACRVRGRGVDMDDVDYDEVVDHAYDSPFSGPLSPAEYTVFELRSWWKYNGRKAEPTGRGAAGAWVSLGFKKLGPGCRRTNSAVAIAYESYCICRLREQRLVEEYRLSEQTTKREQAGAAVQRRPCRLVG
ncbi:hypothetical protein F5883DRAFT_513875 [Diaporthe sp. PMI_573]|nr:hypothetical protein F5883DRAFT_513875 [Diaporthaceae sp. PMI_573]